MCKSLADRGNRRMPSCLGPAGYCAKYLGSVGDGTVDSVILCAPGVQSRTSVR